MFGDSNSSAIQEQVLDLTDRIYDSWLTWVSKIMGVHKKDRNQVPLPTPLSWSVLLPLTLNNSVENFVRAL